MSRNLLIYFVLFNLIQFLLIEINCQSTNFKPQQRYLHTATFIDNKLYILGGRYKAANSAQAVGKDFFFLDFSRPFSTQELSWQDLSSSNTVPPHRGAAAVKGGGNNNTLILYGGNSTDSGMALVYTFDPKGNSWSAPNIAGDNATTRKAFTTGAIDPNGRMYLWGGQEMQSRNYVNDMLIIDTINLGWGKGSSTNAPTPRADYGVVLLPNNNLIYMGGADKNTSLPLSEVYIYDTINDNWNVQKTTGDAPPRSGFSAVLGLDGQRIIVFGGQSTRDNALNVLDLTNYSWYTPKVSGNIPSSRNWHKANVIRKYMVISFGDEYDPSRDSDILLLDISNNDEYVWTDKFSLDDGKNGKKSSGQSSNNKLAMIGAIVASLGVGLLSLFI